MTSHYRNEPEEGSQLIVGKKRIAKALGISIATLWRWAKDDGFPLSDLPNGTTATSWGLIDAWLLGRLVARRSQLGYDRTDRRIEDAMDGY